MLHSKKGRKEGGRGGGFGDRLESPVETHSMLVVVFLHVLLLLFFKGFFLGGGGGGKLLI